MAYFGLFPKISTPVENTVENRGTYQGTCKYWPFLGHFLRGEA